MVKLCAAGLLAMIPVSAVAAVPAPRPPHPAAPPLALSSAPRFPHAAIVPGAMRLVVESDDDGLVGGIQLFASAGIDREAASQSGVAALTAETIARTPVACAAPCSPTTVRDAIAQQGGTFDYTVDGRSVHFSIEGAAGRLAPFVSEFGAAFEHPDFSPATVAAARSALVARAGALEGNALSVGVQMFRRSYYLGSPGRPVYGSAASLASLTSRDVAAFYAKNYVRQGLTASAVGKIDPAVPAALEAIAAAVPDGAVEPVVAQVKTIPANATRIVSRRDVGVPFVVVGFGAPSPNNQDFGAMLVLESLLANAFERTSATTLTAGERSVGAFYLYDTSPASLVVYVNGGRVDPSLALRELVLVSHTLGKSALSSAVLAQYKIAAEGGFVTDTVALSDRSYLLGTLASQGLGTDAINTALIALERTTPADVQRVARRYLQRFIIALVLPRVAPAGATDGT